MEIAIDTISCLEKAATVIRFPLYWTDLNACISGANQAFLAQIGVASHADVMNRPLDECFPGCLAGSIQEHVRQVIETGRTLAREEQVQDVQTGTSRYFSAVRSPLLDANGGVIGVVGTSIELSAPDRSDSALDENVSPDSQKKMEEYSQMAHKVAHDMNSPLTALSVMLNNCNELSEKKRLIFKNACAALKDIANNILNKYTVNERVDVRDDQRCAILCSDFMLKLISERKCQYQHLPVKFDIDIAPAALFAFIRVHSSPFGRAISNIISNAIEALEGIADARLSIRIDASDDFVHIQIKDNGKGMSPNLVERIVQRKSFTAGKEKGHGLGMMQIWDMVDANEVRLGVSSNPGEGTEFNLVLPRTEKADWLVDEINLCYNDIVVILDDDQLIHDTWNLRIRPFLQLHSELLVYHERDGQATLDYIAALNEEERQRVILFCDFELLNQAMNGLQVIEACGLERVFLVTSYYYLSAVQKSAKELGVQILPKQMALVTPLFCAQRYGILKINVDHVVYDNSFYTIEQLREKYGAPV